jgi:hypothetical protein
MIRLPSLQRQVQHAIMSPAELHAGSSVSDGRFPDDGFQLNELLLPSRQLSSQDRFAVYQNAYQLRLLDCLREEFPVFRATVGDEAFDQLARDYLARFPSRSYTLGALSRHFVVHLHDTRPRRGGEDVDWFDFVIDAAEFEHAINSVFDGPGSERCGDSIADESIDMACCPSLRLLTVGHPIDEHWTRIKAGEAPAACRSASTHYAVYRRDYVVRYLRISEAEAQILGHLVDGVPLAESLSIVSDEGLSLSEDWVYARCRRWAAEGFVRPISTSHDVRNHTMTEA